MVTAAAVALAVVGLPSGFAGAESPRQQLVDWSTYGGDAQRTGYNGNESVIGVSNAASLHASWSADLGAVMIAQPVEATGVMVSGSPKDLVYVGTEHGDFYALDASTGAVVWHRNLGSQQTGCGDMPDGVFGIGGAGAIDRTAGLVYVAGGDGRVHGLDLATGSEATGWPVRKVFTPTHEHVYGGINEFAGSLYVVVASYCDFTPYHGNVTRIDLATQKIVKAFYPAGKKVNGGGIWGPGGVSIDPTNGHVFAATGNALTDPEFFRYSDSVVELSGSLKVRGSNYPGLTGGDVDFGATPLLFTAPGCPEQVVAKNKSGVLVVYPKGDLDSGYTQRLQIADVNDWEFNGIPAYSPVTNMVYIGNSSDSSNGPYQHGMVALKVGRHCKLSLAWQQAVGSNRDSVSPPTVANGVVYYGAGGANREYAFNAATGEPLWNSASTIGGRLVAAPTVVNGQLLVASWDHHLYAFAP
jgi:outer membrane protein assembly factor BamB